MTSVPITRHSGSLILMQFYFCRKGSKNFDTSKVQSRVATVREKYLENEILSSSGKSEGIWLMSREI